MSAGFSPTWGRAAAMFSTLTATTLPADGLPPVNGSTGSAVGVDGTAVGVGFAGGGMGALAVAAGGAAVPESSREPIATAVPTPTSRTAVPAATMVCTRRQTKPVIGSAPVPRPGSAHSRAAVTHLELLARPAGTRGIAADALELVAGLRGRGGHRSVLARRRVRHRALAVRAAQALGRDLR